MKKFVSTILIVLLLVGCAYAETLDVSSMTDDELLSAYESIKAEMESRDLQAVTERTLREGKYIIGKDIPAGSYAITCIGTAGEAVGDAYGSLGNMMDAFDDEGDGFGDAFGSLGGLMGDYIDMSVEIIGDYGDVLRSYNMKNGDSFSITLEEGTALQISDGSCTIVSE